MRVFEQFALFVFSPDGACPAVNLVNDLDQEGFSLKFQNGQPRTKKARSNQFVDKSQH